MNKQLIGQTINHRRKELGLTLEEIGNIVGVNKSTVMRWEKGDIATLKTSHVYFLSKVLYLPVETLLGLETKEIIEDANLVKKRAKITLLLEKIKNVEDLEKLEKYIKVVVLGY